MPKCRSARAFTFAASSATRCRTPSTTMKSLPCPCILAKRILRGSMWRILPTAKGPLPTRIMGLPHAVHGPRSPGPERHPMGKDESGTLARVVRAHEQDILAEWMRDQGHERRDALQEVE